MRLLKAVLYPVVTLGEFRSYLFSIYEVITQLIAFAC